MKRLLLLAFAAGLMSSCDKIEGPYKEPVNTGGGNDTTTTGGNNDTSAVQRKILVEDFTGHKCGNCPQATKVVRQIDSIYHGKAVVVAIHAGFFASTSAGNYSYDFRTPDGTTLDQFFGISQAGNPNGMVNRVGYPSTHIKAHTNWTGLVSSYLQAAADAAIKITNSYNESTRSLSTQIESRFLTQQNDSFRLAVYFKEDSIIGYQKDYSLPSGQQDIAGYVHMHAFRGSITGAFGERLSGSSFAPQQKVSKSYNYVLPQAWKAKDTYVVAVLYRTRNYEVMQVDEKKVMP